jgi:hypothetical protein
MVGYRPGGPVDLLVGATLLIPTGVALVAVIRPPAAFDRTSTQAIAVIGVGSALLVMPLLIDVVMALSDGVGLAVAPSSDTAYAAVLALFGTCVYAASGLVVRRDSPSFGSGAVARMTGFALTVTLVSIVAFGAAIVSTADALAGRPGPASPWGPIATGVSPPGCDVAPASGPGGLLTWTAEAMIDSETVGTASIEGARDGSRESWTGDLDSTLDPGVQRMAYVRDGPIAQLSMDGASPTPVTPGLETGSADGSTLDGPVVAMVSETVTLNAAEDLGVESFEGASGRHCRVAVDGDGVMRSIVILRWLADQDVRHPSTALNVWRGQLDWWTFADGQLGKAIVTIGGYPGDAWDTTGLGAEMTAELSALDRRAGHEVASPTE